MRPASIDPPEIWHILWADFRGDVGWDIGANCGQTLGVMGERFKHVYAFEPAAECWPYLEAQAGPHLEVLALALTDTDGPLHLIELPDKIDTGQLVTAGTHGMEWDPDNPLANTRQVHGRTIDSLLRDGDMAAPDFMKIDVEGHEYKVLYGAKRTLAVVRPDLLIEFHTRDLHDQVRDMLVGYGYSCQTIRHPHYPPGGEMWWTHGWIRARQ